MTNGELIQHLQQYPQDATVVCVYACYSDFSIMDADEISYYDGSIKNPFGKMHKYIMRNGQVMEYDEKTWDKREGDPKFLNIIAFPGN